MTSQNALRDESTRETIAMFVYFRLYLRRTIRHRVDIFLWRESANRQYASTPVVSIRLHMSSSAKYL